MRIKKNKIIVSLVVIIVTGAFFYFQIPSSPIYKVDGDTLIYSSNRPTPQFERTLFSENESFNIYKINFVTRPFGNSQSRIYGFLVVPKSAQKSPGIVLLPGGGGTKEGELRLASIIAKESYTVLTIDQRGIGQTGGEIISHDKDLQLFLNGKESQQHLMIYDVLASFDVLKSQKEVDTNNIVVIGESMGARYGMVAGVLEPEIKGVLAISSSGYNVPRDLTSPQRRYYASIDPDHYLSKLSPRHLVILHAQNDSVVPIISAQTTFQKAREPKKFFLTNASNCNHGYCDAMHENLKEGLKFIFEK